MSCELPPFTLLRTEHGNVIARDNRDNQEFVFAECYSTTIAALILAAVTLYTERKAYEKDPATHRPGQGTLALPAPATGHGIQRRSPVTTSAGLNRGTLPLLSQDRHPPLHSGRFMAITADG